MPTHTKGFMRSKIIGFHQDVHGDWVAELACGHQQHVRHHPPWSTRPWVLTAEGRQEKTGAELECPECEPRDTPPEGERGSAGSEGTRTKDTNKKTTDA